MSTLAHHFAELKGTSREREVPDTSHDLKRFVRAKTTLYRVRIFIRTSHSPEC